MSFRETVRRLFFCRFTCHHHPRTKNHHRDEDDESVSSWIEADSRLIATRRGQTAQSKGKRPATKKLNSCPFSKPDGMLYRCRNNEEGEETVVVDATTTDNNHQVVSRQHEHDDPCTFSPAILMMISTAALSSPPKGRARTRAARGRSSMAALLLLTSSAVVLILALRDVGTAGAFSSSSTFARVALPRTNFCTEKSSPSSTYQRRTALQVLASPPSEQQQEATASNGGGDSTRTTNSNMSFNSPSYSFWDTAKICVLAGAGGNGCVSFRREKGQARGGPNGGRGGHGGNVYLQASSHVQTLVACKRTVHVRATPGKNGQGKRKDGVCGNDAIVYVPVGTVVRDLQTQKVAAELSKDGQSVLVAKGGRGGRGNAAFQTNRRTAPKLCEKGAPGATRWIELELRLLAQVGFLGLPNAGKSTLLSVTSAATPKIANYPFTTTVPHLGVCNLSNHPAEGMVLCDIPGLIEGASQGAGMGLHFLKHVQRCKVLLHLIDGSADDPVANYHTLQRELQLYDPIVLANKPQVIVVNKLDLPDVQDRRDELVEQLKQASGHSRVVAISAATTAGVSELFERLSKVVAAEEAKEKSSASTLGRAVAQSDSDVLDAALSELKGDLSSSSSSTMTSDPAIAEESFVPEISFDKTGLDYPPDDFRIESDPSYPGQWRVRGEYVEAVAQMTHWEYPEALERFRRQLEAIGVADALIGRGAEDGDLIMIDKFDFDFSPGRTNPYIPAELLEEEERFLYGGGSAASSRSKSATKGAGDNDDTEIWRPFTQGGYLDMDLDELALLDEGMDSRNGDGVDDDDTNTAPLDGSWDELFDLEFDDDGDLVLDEQDEVWTS